jgi:muramoyltetrapeptide carboxypeptidase
MNLQIGDRVAIISPASRLRANDKPFLQMATKTLEDWGLEVLDLSDDAHHFYLAGPDELRASQLNKALDDSSVKAVFCTRGGYGSPRLLRYIDFELNPAPKLLIGYSDITALHAAVATRWPQIIRIHGPNVATAQFTGESESSNLNRESLRDLIFDVHRAQHFAVEYLCTGQANGKLEGGCLSLIASAVGTPFFPEVEGRILFLEDTGESPYRIDRMLTQLANAGVFDRVAGVVFGVMNKCVDPYNDLKDVLRDLLGSHGFPLAIGLPSGHGPQNLPVVLGREYVMDSESGLISTVRDSQVVCDYADLEGIFLASTLWAPG